MLLLMRDGLDPIPRECNSNRKNQDQILDKFYHYTVLELTEPFQLTIFPLLIVNLMKLHRFPQISLFMGGILVESGLSVAS